MNDVAAQTRIADSAKALKLARWVGFKTIVIREYSRIVRIWAQTIVPSAVTSALYFVIFGSLIGKRVGLMDGVPYMQYIAPGLIMMAVITNSYGNVVSSFFGAKFGKHVEEMLVAPLPNWIIVLAMWAAGWCVGSWSVAPSRSSRSSSRSSPCTMCSSSLQPWC
jgi:ABC-type multidrug transport system permease subunit